MHRPARSRWVYTSTTSIISCYHPELSISHYNTYWTFDIYSDETPPSWPNMKFFFSRGILHLLFLGLVFHLVYIGTVFDCYFTSPVVNGMLGHDLGHGPAKRLVLIVGTWHALYATGLDCLLCVNEQRMACVQIWSCLENHFLWFLTPQISWHPTCEILWRPEVLSEYRIPVCPLKVGLATLLWLVWVGTSYRIEQEFSWSSV